MLDEREQKYATWAAWLGGALSIAVWAPAFDEPAAIGLAGIGVVMAALLLLAARRRHRLFAGGAALLLAFGPWGLAWLVGLPFLVLAGWLLVRAPRTPRPPREPRPPRRRRGEAGEVAAGESAKGAPPARPATPKANRRYTPPQRRP